MPMAPYGNIGDNGRISAIRAVGTALGVASTSMPSQSASQGNQHQHKWLLALCTTAGVPLPLSIDYGAFTSIINACVAKVP